eukprot:513515-Pyramimonas_sp.AAC.1
MVYTCACTPIFSNVLSGSREITPSMQNTPGNLGRGESIFPGQESFEGGERAKQHTPQPSSKVTKKLHAPQRNATSQYQTNELRAGGAVYPRSCSYLYNRAQQTGCGHRCRSSQSRGQRLDGSTGRGTSEFSNQTSLTSRLTRAAPVPTPGLLSAAGSRVGPRRGVGSGRGGRVLRLSSHGSRRRLKVSKTLSRWRLFSRGLGRAYRHRRGSGTGWGCRRRRRRSEASAPAAVLSASSQITRLGDRSGREATGYPARPKV